MSVEQSKFGSLPVGEVTLYKLVNSSGMEVHVMDYGVCVTSILLPSEGGKDNVVCGFNTLEGYFADAYLANSPYFGSVIGRYCSTIKDGRYGDVELVKNCDHSLHGGVVGFDKRMWSAKSVGESEVTFVLNSEDGDQGFPGAVEAEVTVSLSDDNELAFSYVASSSKRTPFAMTNHTYFNLSAFRESVESHTMQLDSSVIVPLNSEGSFELVQQSVAGGADDLSKAKSIAEAHAAMGDGFEHYYLFEGGVQSVPRKVGAFEYAPLGRSVEISTTEQGMLFYTGKYTSDELARESGEQYGKHRGLCCETHRVANGPNIEGAPSVFLEAGEQFSSQTIFKFKF